MKGRLTETATSEKPATPRPPRQTERRPEARTIPLVPASDEMLARWEQGLPRSQQRRGRRRSPRETLAKRAILGLATATMLGAFAVAGSPVEQAQLRAGNTARPGSSALGDPGLRRHAPSAGAYRIPSAAGVGAAERYAVRRGGLVSFAVIDSRGNVHGSAIDRPYVSASVVKVMLLAAELRRLQQGELPLDGLSRDLLTRMITYSDNASADQIYYRVGDAGLYAVAADAEMDAFTVSGYWANAQLTARDLAGLMSRLRDVLPAAQRRFALSLLGGIVPQQSWGIPAAVSGGWELRFKGGWRSTELGQLVHQAAEIRPPKGPPLALAILTDAQPSQDYGIETIRGITDRMLNRR